MSPSGGEKLRSSGVRFPPPLLYLAGLVAGWLLHRFVHPLPTFQDWPRYLLAGAFTIAGLALPISTRISFHRAGTSILPIRPTTALVTGGPFRFSRNPAYLGMAMLYAGIGFWIGSWWPLCLLPLVLLGIQQFVITKEERYLESLFGEDYRAYQRRVRRWL
ncbi:MAG TPA: isoprenylcysteine carboxylmethyltransferase family protein [Terriglobales bacterium]|nr:isoprenylcysteine carboxylmethyltransferase family protein [Terriglobales bacterium]